ncbi:MAG: endonuclease NucS [Phycisphaerae bacterium]|nr:endonuclease NucS [Phycisphaerae bacterium]
MSKYKHVDVSERDLEELIRRWSDHIEEGMRFVDHQCQTDRGPLDILLVDSGNALCVAELKVCEDDSMLWQGLDYYDFLSKNVHAVGRCYPQANIDPEQEIRLLLVAPNFSMNMLGRCKWIDVPLSLFTYKCITVDGTKDTIPVFNEVTIPSLPAVPQVTPPSSHSNYITNPEARALFVKAMDEIKSWDPMAIAVDSIKYHISIKFNNRVLCYLTPQRKQFSIGAYFSNDVWTYQKVESVNDYERMRPLLQAALQRLKAVQ